MRHIIFLLGSLLLLAACGGAPTELSTGGRLRASTVQPDSAAVLNTETCAVLTPAEVASLTGRPVRQLSQGAACLFVEDGSGASADAVVVDAFDALTSARPYKQPWPEDRALEASSNKQLKSLRKLSQALEAEE